MTTLPANATLVVVDVQQGFLDSSRGPRNNLDAEINVARPIRHVHHLSRSPAGTSCRGTPGHEAKPEATPLPSEPIYLKEVNSSFIGTSLGQDLRAEGCDTLVVIGLTTNRCMPTTVRMAGNPGFTTYVAEDATATFDRKGLAGEVRPAAEVHAAALSDLSNEFATVVRTKEVIQALNEREPHLV